MTTTKKRPHKAGKTFVSVPIVSPARRAANHECGVIETALAVVFQATLIASTELRRYGVTQRLRSSLSVMERQVSNALWITDYILTEKGAE